MSQGDHQVLTANSVYLALVGKGVKMIPHLPYSPNIAPVDFSLSKSEVRAGWSLAVPRQLQDELGRGHADHHRRQVPHCLLNVVLALRQVHLTDEK